MPEEMNIGEEVESIIAAAMNVDESDFDDDTPIGPEGLDADSLSVVEMAEVVSMDLGVDVPDEALEELETVRDVKSYVAEHYE